MFNNHIEVCHLQIVFTSYKCPVLHWFDCRFLGNVLKNLIKKLSTSHVHLFQELPMSLGSLKKLRHFNTA